MEDPIKARQAPEGPKRVLALDGLRGVAALIVVLGHSFGAIEIPGWGRLLYVQSPLVVFLNAIGAVHLFFVLSGFCLAGSYQRGRDGLSIVQFLIRRVFRIYPPYVFAVVLTWGLSFWYVTPLAERGVSAEYLGHLAVHVEPGVMFAALRFPGAVQGQLPHGYTLEIEMIFSLLFPLLMWMSSRLHWGLLVLLSLLAIFATGELHYSQRYGLDFALGIGLYMEQDRLAEFFRRLPRSISWGLVLLGLAIFNYPTYAVLMFEWWGVVPFAVGGTLLVAGAIHLPGFAGLLSSRPVAALGRISYSSYLLHFALLCWLTRLIDHRLGVWEGLAFIALVVMITLFVSSLSYRWVERPAIRLGNRLCHALATSFGAREHPSRRFMESESAP